jgi:hypothetical protein
MRGETREALYLNCMLKSLTFVPFQYSVGQSINISNISINLLEPNGESV